MKKDISAGFGGGSGDGYHYSYCMDVGDVLVVCAKEEEKARGGEGSFCILEMPTNSLVATVPRFFSAS